MLYKEINLGINTADFPAFDADIFGNYIAFNGENIVHINGKTIHLKEKIKLNFPLARRLNEHFFLLVGTRAANVNAFVFSTDGILQKSFFVGDAIEDIVIRQEKIIVSYFDEGVFGNPPSTEGLAVFDSEGKMLFGVNSSIGEEYICDCYALCPSGKNAVLFFAYDEFELSKLNLDTFQLEHMKVPDVLAGACAMVSDKQTVIFYAPYQNKNTFFRYHLYSKQISELGKVDFPVIKGLDNGCFLAIKNNSYHIIDFNSYF